MAIRCVLLKFKTHEHYKQQKLKTLSLPKFLDYNLIFAHFIPEFALQEFRQFPTVIQRTGIRQ